MFTHLQSRLTVIFVLLAVAPLVVANVIVGSRGTRVLEQTALESLDETARRVGIETDAFIAEKINELQLVVDVNDFQEAADLGELETILFRRNTYTEIAVVAADRREIVRYTRQVSAEDQQLRDRSSEAIIDTAFRSATVAYGEVFFDADLREPLMEIALPVIDVQSGAPTFVLTALFSFRPVWDIVSIRQVNDATEAFILSPENQVIAHRDPSIVFAETVVELPADTRRLMSEADGEVIFAATPLPIGDRTLTVVVTRPLAQAFAIERETTIAIILITLTSLLIATGLVIVVVRQVVRPILGLVGVAQQISAGDLTARVAIAGRDEIAQLGASFNAMADQQAGLINSLEKQVADRTLALQDALNDVEARASEQAELLGQIEQQREDIRALSVPLLPIDRGTLVLPLVGVFDSERLNQVQERALQSIQASGTRRLILDVTGTPVIDSQVAQGLMAVVQAARLLGTEVTLVGIRPEVAQTIVGLGLDFQGVRVFSTLEAALAVRNDRATTPIAR